MLQNHRPRLCFSHQFSGAVVIPIPLQHQAQKDILKQSAIALRPHGRKYPVEPSKTQFCTEQVSVGFETLERRPSPRRRTASYIGLGQATRQKLVLHRDIICPPCIEKASGVIYALTRTYNTIFGVPFLFHMVHY